MKNISAKLIQSFLVTLFTFTAFSGFSQKTSGEVLTAMNKEYNNKNYDKCIKIGKQVEGFDLYGKDGNTASVYATIGTCYAYKAMKEEEDKNYKEAAKYYYLSAKYNRAFAAAVATHKTGNNEVAKGMWESKTWNFDK